jgi:hypothetical protein
MEECFCPKAVHGLGIGKAPAVRPVEKTDLACSLVSETWLPCMVGPDSMPWVAFFCQGACDDRGVGTVPALGGVWGQHLDLAARKWGLFRFYVPPANMEGRERQPWAGNFCRRSGNDWVVGTVHAVRLGRRQQLDLAEWKEW